MKKLLSSVLAAAMMVSVAAFASADEATIPLYVTDLDIPAMQEVPGIATQFDPGKQVTTLWASMPLDWVNVNAYLDGENQQVPLELNEDHTSATYSNRDMKRQVGECRTGGEGKVTYDKKWMQFAGTTDETAAVKQLLEEYTQKGYASSDIVLELVKEVDTDVYNFYVDVGGKKEYVGYYDYDKNLDEEKNEQNAKNVMNYLAAVENYNPDALSYERETTYKPVDKGQGYSYNVFLKPSYTWTRRGVSSDDAYYVGVGTQTSVHGRDGSCHMVYAWSPEDLFYTDMECTGTTVTWAYNDNAKEWYPAAVSANYENAFTTNITAEYAPDVDQNLEGYTVKYNDNGVVYTVNYNAYGGMETAKAVDLNGTEFKSVGSSYEFDWVNTATLKFMRNFSLLPLSELKVTLK